MLLCRPHLLLLDEPTNNLDLDAVHALQEAIVNYAGSCIIASHDMAFVSACATTNVYHLRASVLTRLEGGVEEYKQVVKASVNKQKRSRS
jgi:ATP-binding cassette, subfamily F, member 3